jgi:hypothetical protein
MVASFLDLLGAGRISKRYQFSDLPGVVVGTLGFTCKAPATDTHEEDFGLVMTTDEMSRSSSEEAFAWLPSEAVQKGHVMLPRLRYVHDLDEDRVGSKEDEAASDHQNQMDLGAVFVLGDETVVLSHRRVFFNESVHVSEYDITPYAEIYGQHPCSFDFDSSGEMLRRSEHSEY